jgi:hypothetical protein
VLINVTSPLHVPQWRETQSAAVKAAIAVVPFAEGAAFGVRRDRSQSALHRRQQ